MKRLEELARQDLAEGIRMKALCQQAGPEWVHLLPEIYEAWKAQQLRVWRDWGRSDLRAQALDYHLNACLLPEDRLQWRRGPQVIPALKLATWNVNSLRARLGLVIEWIRTQRPDILCLQETKVEDAQFPLSDLQAEGYHVAFTGQKSYNGVAILSRWPLEEVRYGFSEGFDAENKRLIAARIQGLWVVNVYVPQGESTSSPKFAYKLQFLEALTQELTRLYTPQTSLALLGDINIAPEARDLSQPEAWRGRVSFHPEEHRWLQAWRDWGLIDLYRQFHQDAGRYSWWDFRTRGFERNEGMRIDLIWATLPLREACRTVEIDLEPRLQEKPSDHAPVWAAWENLSLA